MAFVGFLVHDEQKKVWDDDDNNNDGHDDPAQFSLKPSHLKKIPPCPRHNSIKKHVSLSIHWSLHMYISNHVDIYALILVSIWYFFVCVWLLVNSLTKRKQNIHTSNPKTQIQNSGDASFVELCFSFHIVWWFLIF